MESAIQPAWAYPNKPSDDAVAKYFTKENLEYQPTELDTFITNSKGQSQRLIFQEPLVLKDYETEHLNNFRKYLRDNNLSIPQGYDNEGRLLLRYLQGLNWKYDVTQSTIVEHNKWCNENIPFNLKCYEDYIPMGILYIYKRDRGHRPIIVINTEKLISSKIDVDGLVYVSNFQIDYIIRNCMIPGKIENWSVILNMDNVGLTQIPKSLLQGMISAMTKNYRGRMFRLFAVYVAWLVKGLWSVAKTLIDEFTATKINMYGDSGFKEDILKIIDEKNLEEHFGGKLPDKKDNFFPPQLI